MRIHHFESSATAASTAAAAPRVDLYRHVHKALRALMADTLLNVGRMDPADDLELAEATQQVLQMAAACRSHLAHEDAFVHPAMQACAPGSAAGTAEEHAEHLADIAALERAVGELRSARPGARDALAHALYHQVGAFMAHNFTHMQMEETANNALLWAGYGDHELLAIHGALIASIPPDEMMGLLRWAVPFMNAAERADVLGDMQRQLPPPAFGAVLDMARPHLRPREWDKLQLALALTPELAPC